MNIYNIFNVILILFLILIVGVIAKRFNAVSEEFNKGLIDFIMNVSLPALIINSMNYEFSAQMLSNGGILILLFAVIYGLSIVLAVAVTRLFKIKIPEKNVYQFMLVFPNVGFMGYPIINAVYGQQGVFYTAIYNLPINLLLWTIGIIIMSDGKEENKFTPKSLVNPCTIAVLAGIILFASSIKLPSPIMSTIEMIGSTTTPLSMILVGFILANSSLRKVFSKPMVFIMSLIRLVAMPLLFLIILRPFISDPLILGVPVVISAMPGAANAVVFAGKFEGDSYTASQTVFISTMLSVITIPLIVYIIGTI